MKTAGSVIGERVFFAAVFLAGAAVALVLSLANGWLGPLNQDEGWYLVAARMVYDGALPYRDFAFTQGPVMPVLYAPLMPLIERGGLLGARAFTVVLAWLTALTAAALAGRLAPPPFRRAAFCMAWILVSVNVYQSYFTTIVKTYAAAGLFLTAGLYLLFAYRGKPPVAALAGSAAALVLAAGTRLSLAVVAPVMLLALWGKRRAWPRAWLWFGSSALLTGLLMLLPLAVAAPEGIWFGMVEYHASRVPGGLMETAALKAGFVSRVVQGYYVAVLAGLSLVALRFFFGNISGRTDDMHGVFAGLRRAAGIALALVTLVHFLSPFPYDDYQTVVYAPFCALLAAALVRRMSGMPCHDARFLRTATLILLGAAIVSSFSSPINQDWFVSGRDRIWWRIKPQPDMALLRDTARRVRRLYDAPGGELLTQDAYLAVEAGCRVPASMALGPFSYFPDMSTERARALRVLNRELMLELFRHSMAPAAAFSGYGLSIAAPEITELPAGEREQLWRALLEYYEPYEEVPLFGQAHTTLHVLRRRNREKMRDEKIPGK